MTGGGPGASMRRTREQGDAIVVFGITGDLAFKHIIPALQRWVPADELKVPVVGVAGQARARNGYTSTSAEGATLPAALQPRAAPP